jgi:3-deoxy-D-manno-octulosonate 8-phosphate phosphatase (KDO 8-P phosphatase)
MDVDGVLSDAGITYGSGGQEIKRFFVRDGQGLYLAKLAGIKLAVITVRESEAVFRRCNELNVDYLFQGIDDKWSILQRIMNEVGIDPEEIAYIGDDLVDIPVMEKVGFPVAVGDAVQEVKEVAKHVTQKKGGNGAVRETVEYILKGMGLWEKTLRDYFEKITSSPSKDGRTGSSESREPTR